MWAAMADPRADVPDPSSPARQSWGRAFVAVFWSFFGVRKGKDYDIDVTSLTPGQVIAAGLVSALAFIAVLVTIVYFVTR
jgi:Protein of unknown function (DUF2970)